MLADQFHICKKEDEEVDELFSSRATIDSYRQSNSNEITRQVLVDSLNHHTYHHHNLQTNSIDRRITSTTMPTCFDTSALSLTLVPSAAAAAAAAVVAHNAQQHNPHIHHHHHHQQQQQNQYPHEAHLAAGSLSPPQQSASNFAASGRAAIRYYQPLMDVSYTTPLAHHHHHSMAFNANLNQKRESVITFSSNNSNNTHSNNQNRNAKSLGYTSHEQLLSGGDNNQLGDNNRNSKEQQPLALIREERSSTGHGSLKLKSDLIVIDGVPFTLEQIVCICQVLQKCDLNKLEKFIYSFPPDTKLAKNELILRARTIAAFYSGNYKLVYDLLENNHFSVKYHQELQNLWNNAHYKEHEMKRGHPPGAVEKYRIRKKYQFPRTIWDGEEYVYCFKEKNRRILKEFYQKCNLPTQEDKIKLANQTQLTVVQSKYSLLLVVSSHVVTCEFISI